LPRYVLAVDLGGTKCAAAVIDRTGRIIAKIKEPVDARSPSAPITQIVAVAKDLASPNSPKTAFKAAGVAVPGLVRRNGTVWAPNLPGWNRMPLETRLRRALHFPVIVESDRNAAVLGECWRGAGRGKSDVIVLIIGTGIGAGILSGGHILRGAHELSGCVGWLVVSGLNTRQASLVGELESLAAGPAIARAAQKLAAQRLRTSLSRRDWANITALEIANQARRKDRLAVRIFQDCGRMLGVAVANLISLFDPQMVVIGGGLAGAADLFLEPLKRTAMDHAQPLAAKQVNIVVSRLGETGNLLGCAKLAWEVAREDQLT
jgi:glucokinase